MLRVVLHVLEAEKDVRCVVDAVISCVLLVYGRSVMYAGGWSCAQCNRDSGGRAPCTVLYAGGRGRGALFAEVRTVKVLIP